MKKLLFAATLCLMTLVAQAQTTNQNPYYSFIQQQITSPFDYVTQKIRQYNVVSLGEDHWIKDHMEFLTSYLDYIAADTTFHIDVLAWESGNSIDQQTADSLMMAQTFREDLALKVLRDAPETYGWPYKEAVDVIKALWRYNRKQQKFTRLLLLDPPYMMQLLDGEKYTYTLSRDQSTANKIASYIGQNKKVLFYAGASHTGRQFHAVYNPKSGMYHVQATAGKILSTLYPRLVFSIKLWGGLMGSNGYIPADDEYKWERCGDGLADEAFRDNGNRPIAFDIADSPFASLKVSDFFHFNYSEQMLSTTNGSPFYETETMGDRIDGIVFFRPVNEFSIPHLEPKMFDDAFVERISKRTNGEVKTKNDVFQYIKKGHPTLAEETDKYIE
jgi:uncharacterized iron-regulated protein